MAGVGVKETFPGLQTVEESEWTVMNPGDGVCARSSTRASPTMTMTARSGTSADS